MKRLDLSKDFSKVYDFIARRTKAFDPDDNQGPGDGERVSRIDVGFGVYDEGWVCLVFDTRPNPEPDGEWNEYIEETVLERPRWAEAREAVEAAPFTLVLPDGATRKLAAGETGPLVQALGDMLRAALLKARDEGLFKALPKTRECEMGVEEQEGSYGWPAHESRGTDNLVEPRSEPDPTRSDRISQKCLRGQPLPDDLRRLWDANDVQPWGDFVVFNLVEDLDGDFFNGYRESDRVPAEVAAAYKRMFQHIAFVGKREDGELVGYWLGPENRPASASPIVELDTEGQFDLRGRNLAEYLLSCTHSRDDYARLRRVLIDLGLKVAATTPATLLKSFDALQGEFGSPNGISIRYQKGLDAPPPSTVRFGHYTFPDAARALESIGVTNIAAGTTKNQVIEALGAPDASGGETKSPILGKIDAWIKYNRADCQLHISFGKGDVVKKVTMMEPDWEPGM